MENSFCCHKYAFETLGNQFSVTMYHVPNFEQCSNLLGIAQVARYVYSVVCCGFSVFPIDIFNI